MTLTEFLLARIGEDEAIARGERRMSERLTPERLMAECEAKRRIVERHDTAHQCPDGGGPRSDAYFAGGDERFATCPTLIDLALPYADHPDYREEWRP